MLRFVFVSSVVMFLMASGNLAGQFANSNCWMCTPGPCPAPAIQCKDTFCVASTVWIPGTNVMWTTFSCPNKDGLEVINLTAGVATENSYGTRTASLAHVTKTCAMKRECKTCWFSFAWGGQVCKLDGNFGDVVTHPDYECPIIDCSVAS